MSRNHITKGYSQDDSFIQQFFARIPAKTAATLTDTQLVALKQALSNRVGKGQAVDIRVSIPIFKWRFYLVFLLGREKRSKERLAKERLLHPIFTIANTIFLTILSLLLITALLGSLYIIDNSSEISNFPFPKIQHFGGNLIKKFLN